MAGVKEPGRAPVEVEESVRLRAEVSDGDRLSKYGRTAKLHEIGHAYRSGNRSMLVMLAACKVC